MTHVGPSNVGPPSATQIVFAKCEYYRQKVIIQTGGNGSEHVML